MLSPRTGTILKYIVDKYIERVMPVSSQSIADSPDLRVSSATVRNEMASLEHEGYIIRPHTSAGSVPADKGYRFYVESLGEVHLNAEQQFMLSHLFHQVEREVEEWLSLTATVLARMANNMAIITMPKSADCKFKHMELVAIRDTLVLAVLVLHGAILKQKLISLEKPVTQSELAIASNRLNAAYSGLTGGDISKTETELSPLERALTDHVVEMMQAEDGKEHENPYLDGLHFMFSQPEFAHSQRLKALMELIESKGLVKVIAPPAATGRMVHVVIGKENKAEAIQECSVVISQYGVQDASGTIGVIGPTRMHYSDTISAVDYLSSVLSRLMAGLYGRAPTD